MTQPAHVWKLCTRGLALLSCAALCASVFSGCAGQQVRIENQTVIHEAPKPLRVTYSLKVVNADGTPQWQEGQRIDYEYENLTGQQPEKESEK